MEPAVDGESLYAIRDFYKRELKGTEIDNPGHDDWVEGTRATLVLLIGRKATHVPKVRARKMRDRAHARACIQKAS